MPLRFGPGPVFIHESIAATRRWQHYGMRSLFVFGLLLALALVLGVMVNLLGQPAGSVSIRLLATFGESFYYGIATTQLVLVLLIAPAATAGAICVDRASGTLTHMMVTDLSDSEIVLGKLAARLLPVFALMLATVPVLALTGLLGGIIVEAIATLTLVTVVLALLVCALALALSVRASKVHEVLMAVYGIEALLVLGPPLWSLLADVAGLPKPPEWFVNINPFVLAWAPYARSASLDLMFCSVALATATLLSAALITYSVLRLRAETTKTTNSRASRKVAFRPVLRPSEATAKVHLRTPPRGSTIFNWIPSSFAWIHFWRRTPSLDTDPVLWREWRRGRPSRLAKTIWGIYITLAVAATAWSILLTANLSTFDSHIIGLLSGLQATFGLLLVSIHAPTALAEERARGSLDVLLTTPLSTSRIVLAKWWNAYRIVPALAFLPAIAALFVGFASPDVPAEFTRLPAAFARSAEHHDAINWIDRLAFVSLPTALFLAQGAVVTSFGLALTTWIRRLGRAIAVSVAAYAFIAFGWIVTLELGLARAALSWNGLIAQNDRDAWNFLELIEASTCPLGAQLSPYQSVQWTDALNRYAFYIAHLIVLLLTVAVALVFLGLTLASFNRSMGRMPERPRRPPHPPRKIHSTRRPHQPVSGSRDAVLAHSIASV